MPEFERETVEFLPLAVRVDGQVVTTGVEFAVLPADKRPSDFDTDQFIPATTLDGKTGVLIRDLDPGRYQAWWRVTSNPEKPVRRAKAHIQIN